MRYFNIIPLAYAYRMNRIHRFLIKYLELFHGIFRIPFKPMAKLFQCNSNDKADDSDYPDLTSDSGVDSDSDDAAYFSELQVSSLTSQLNNQIDFISSNINGPVFNSESKNPEVFCCKCHAQGAKCINC